MGSWKTAQIEDFSFHDLYHTAASLLRMRGANIHTVAQLLGHKYLRMAARYSHLSADLLGDAVRKLDGVFPKADDQRTWLTEASVTSSYGARESLPAKLLILCGVPDGIRTHVIAVKGRCPGPG